MGAYRADIAAPDPVASDKLLTFRKASGYGICDTRRGPSPGCGAFTLVPVIAALVFRHLTACTPMCSAAETTGLAPIPHDEFFDARPPKLKFIAGRATDAVF